jgi:hypothetical protein
MAATRLRLALAASLALAMIHPALTAEKTPSFKIDPSFPKELPHQWILGQIGGIFVDAQDHIWINQRPGTLDAREKRAATVPTVKCCVPAPPVIEFDQQGNVIQAWGGPGAGYTWPANEHGIFVDANNFVWVAGNGMTDGLVLKFTRDGKFVLQIGKSGPMTSSADTTQLGRPADMVVDTVANEVYVADGYFNHRVIVFDSNTGAFKRMWGAYGKPPTDDKITYDGKAPLPQQFNNPVHGIRITKDGLVMVGDRANNRVQVFQKNGTFVKQFVFEEASRSSGSAFDLVFSNDLLQMYLYLADGTNDQVLTVLRETGKVVTSFGRPGRFAGEFLVLHNIAIDSKDNLYTSEVATGKRVQKFSPAN